MGTAADFALLYSELGVEPGADMEQLKRAYRRRVGVLHPDANGGRGDTARLQALNQLYFAALDFHRVHGRLPGAVARARPLAAMRYPAPARHGGDAGDAGHAPGRVARYGASLAVVGLVAATLWMQAPDRQGEGPGRDPPALAGGKALALPARATSPAIGLGIDHARLAAIQGKPHVVDGSRWVYGPSWVEVRCGVVVDWYSSPLHPLQAPATRPSADSPWLEPEPAGRCWKE